MSDSNTHQTAGRYYDAGVAFIQLLEAHQKDWLNPGQETFGRALTQFQDTIQYLDIQDVNTLIGETREKWEKETGGWNHHFLAQSYHSLRHFIDMGKEQVNLVELLTRTFRETIKQDPEEWNPPDNLCNGLEKELSDKDDRPKQNVGETYTCARTCYKTQRRDFDYVELNPDDSDMFDVTTGPTWAQVKSWFVKAVQSFLGPEKTDSALGMEEVDMVKDSFATLLRLLQRISYNLTYCDSEGNLWIILKTKVSHPIGELLVSHNTPDLSRSFLKKYVTTSRTLENLYALYRRIEVSSSKADDNGNAFWDGLANQYSSTALNLVLPATLEQELRRESEAEGDSKYICGRDTTTQKAANETKNGDSDKTGDTPPICMQDLPERLRKIVEFLKRHEGKRVKTQRIKSQTRQVEPSDVFYDLRDKWGDWIKENIGGQDTQGYWWWKKGEEG